MAVHSEIISHAGWDRNLRLSNGACELITTLQVGPRVLSFRTQNGENVFRTFPDDLGTVGEENLKLRGGHRLWAAPEYPDITYHPDNQAVDYCPTCDGGATFLSKQQEPIQIEKRLTLHLDDTLPRVTAEHAIKNIGPHPLSLATWALTIMEPGGIEIIPHPAPGSHPEDILPNRNLVLWPYTDLADERYTMGSRFILLRQMEDRPATKIGLSHSSRWVAYLNANSLFIKSVEFHPERQYPDMGCNFETFTNGDFLELETLGPLATLKPGEATSHTETWHLFDLEEPAEIHSEESLEEWLRPFLAHAGFAD